MSPYAVAGILAFAGVGGLGLIVWLVWRFGKSAGASSQQADSSGAALKVEKKMAQAAADAPADVKAVEDSLRKGTF